MGSPLVVREVYTGIGVCRNWTFLRNMNVVNFDAMAMMLLVSLGCHIRGITLKELLLYYWNKIIPDLTFVLPSPGGRTESRPITVSNVTMHSAAYK